MVAQWSHNSQVWHDGHCARTQVAARYSWCYSTGARILEPIFDHGRPDFNRLFMEYVASSFALAIDRTVVILMPAQTAEILAAAGISGRNADVGPLRQRAGLVSDILISRTPRDDRPAGSQWNSDLLASRKKSSGSISVSNFNFLRVDGDFRPLLGVCP
jgi:hypothetical protein